MLNVECRMNIGMKRKGRIATAYRSALDEGRGCACPEVLWTKAGVAQWREQLGIRVDGQGNEGIVQGAISRSFSASCFGRESLLN